MMYQSWLSHNHSLSLSYLVTVESTQKRAFNNISEFQDSCYVNECIIITTRFGVPNLTSG
jgi:hypothetical protein